MSTLTKVFIVLLVIFSIAFASMTVSVATQTANWREVARRFDEHARVADANLRNLIASNAAELTAAADTVNGHLDTIAEMEAQLQEARSAVEQRTADIRRLEGEKSSAEAMSHGLQSLLLSSEATRDEYRGQRDDLERQGVDLQQRNIDLNDRVNELTAHMAVLLEQKRQFEQQINVLRAENDKLARQTRTPSSGMAMESPTGAAMSNVTALTPPGAPTVRGRVVDVSGDIVTISVGSADGVRQKMVFVIHRGGEYIGDLKISVVDPNQAAGRLVSSRFVPAPGDEVTDELGLAGSRG